MQKSYDGRWTLAQLQRTIGTDEQAEFLILKSIAQGPNTRNVATFDTVAADADIAPDLKLQTESAPEGVSPLFDTTLYVEGKAQRVVGYR